eukprot:TRINITY_DN11073_c0_g3_i1.p1 TRINITY_DN11073_c0_g3~~TRINITY_DN11073_c0_g3_i1.p1  ORF type:complete len:485 (-),score=100.86 TRINITY_DN11073_c0_g3_i1:11-1465(-)
MFRKERNVFLGGLGLEKEVDDLRKLVSEVGGLTYATVWKDDESGRGKGAGKLEFENAECAQKAIEVLRAPSAVHGSVAYATIFSDVDANHIDIRYDQALNWFNSRGKLASDWRSELDNIQAKASLALANALSEAPASNVLFLDLQACNETAEIRDVLELYKQNNVHVAESAAALTQIVRFDLPSAKAQAQSFQKQVQEVERRSKDLSQEEIDAKRKLKEMCDAHQISGNDFAAELQAKISKTVPQCFESATGKISSNCSEPLRFYCAFSKAMHEDTCLTEETVMPVLRFVIANGNAALKDAASVSDDLAAELKRTEDRAKGSANDAKMLDNTYARSLLMTDLLELQSFLSERCLEVEEQGCEEFQVGTEKLSAQEAKGFRDAIAEIIADLSGEHVPLMLMNASPDALARVVSKLASQKALCERLTSKASALEKSKTELLAEADLHAKAVSQHQDKAKKLRGWLEEEISRIMKLEIRLVGEVDML